MRASSTSIMQPRPHNHQHQFSTAVRSRPRAVIAASVICAAAALTARPAFQRVSRVRDQQKLRNRKPHRRWLDPLAVEALCGAVGEMGQILVFYPMDTLKIQCQAHSLGSRAAWASIVSRHSGPVQLLRSMYAGCGSQVLCSAAIGAVYLLSFYQLKRVFRGMRHRAPDSVESVKESQTFDMLTAVLPAATMSSLMTSLIEAPVEMFRHRVQAGQIQGHIFKSMGSALRNGGLGALYSGHTAFIMQGLPYDVSELVTYSQLRAVKGPLNHMPAEVRDMLIGACAGAWAVVCSMPADCIKTRLELTATRCNSGVLTNVALFMRTARSMVKQEGLQSMFVGMGPRLACAIPSAMVYWLAVEACRRALEPVTQREPPADLRALPEAI